MDLRKCHLTWDLAEQHCNRGDLDCRWYHGNWELLKALRIVSTSGVHAEEIRTLLAEALNEKPQSPRILLSGSTDDSLLQVLINACRVFGRSPKVTAIDICDTPLELMRRYSSEHTINFSSIKTDILEYNSDIKYDIILTHAFMGNFDQDGRKLLLRKWASILNEGGCVVTVQRVRPPDAPPVVRFSADQSAEFMKAALAAAAEELDTGLRESGWVETAVTEFTQHFRSHSITSRAELEQLFLGAGFGFRHLNYRCLEIKANLSGPSVPSGGEYAFIIAEKLKPK